jgi:RNA-directed DNA polymerase
VKNFFDEIDRSLLFQKLLDMGVDDLSLFVIIGLTTSPIIDSQNRMSIPERGIGQGASVCPLIANLYAHEIDLCLESLGVRHVRWLDDILVLSKSKEDTIHARTLASTVATRSLGLELHEKDTTGYVWEQSFLGFQPTDDGKFLIADKSYARLISRVEYWLKRRRDNPTEAIERISQALRGWINFYHTASAQDLEALYRNEKAINDRIRRFLHSKDLHPHAFKQTHSANGWIQPSLTRELGWR